MDAEKLIEEAEALSNAATPGPWCHNSHGVNNWPGPEAPARVMELLHNQDDDDEQNHRDSEFIARARTLVPELAAALRETTARADSAVLEALNLKQRQRALELVSADAIRKNDELAACLRSANALVDAMRKERDDLAAANVAANKRIEALEHERDEAREWVRKMMRETQTLTCVYCGHAYPPGTPTHGSEVLTAHIEQCERHPARRLVLERDAARAELARLTTPRPIAEAPRDGTWVLCKSSAGWREGQFCGLNFDPPNCYGWFGRDNRELRRVVEFLPLPAEKAQP